MVMRRSLWQWLLSHGHRSLEMSLFPGFPPSVYPISEYMHGWQKTKAGDNDLYVKARTFTAHQPTVEAFTQLL